ncbi:MAG: hypothetical protein IPK19_27880 [Chloroflexi bacterium]|nr:hypothetical protein [Chloroflexota bacterium]
MRYWAIRLYSAIQKVIALLVGLTAVVGFLLSLFTLDALRQTLAQLGIPFADGAFAMALIALCSLGAALLSALGVYAFAQVLELLISLDENLRGLRWDLRQRGRMNVESLAPDPPPPFVAPNDRYMYGIRNRED